MVTSAAGCPRLPTQSPLSPGYQISQRDSRREPQPIETGVPDSRRWVADLPELYLAFVPGDAHEVKRRRDDLSDKRAGPRCPFDILDDENVTFFLEGGDLDLEPPPCAASRETDLPPSTLRNPRAARACGRRVPSTQLATRRAVRTTTCRGSSMPLVVPPAMAVNEIAACTACTMTSKLTILTIIRRSRAASALAERPCTQDLAQR